MTVFFARNSATWPFFLQAIPQHDGFFYKVFRILFRILFRVLFSTLFRILPIALFYLPVRPLMLSHVGRVITKLCRRSMYAWTGAVRRRKAWSRPRGLGGGPEGPQEPQWDTAAATLGSGGEGGEWILDKFGRGHIQIFDRLSNLFNKAPIPRTKQSPQIQNNALKCKTKVANDNHHRWLPVLFILRLWCCWWWRWWLWLLSGLSSLEWLIVRSIPLSSLIILGSVVLVVCHIYI